MRKLTLLFLALLTFLLPTAKAQQTLTVNDGTAQMYYSPFYVFYSEHFTKVNSIYPANELADMDGGSINSMTFYIAVEGSCSSTWELYLKEVDYAEVPTTPLDVSTATKVFEGTINTNASTLTIVFDEPFVYNGGYLMMASQNTTNPDYRSVKFYGSEGSGYRTGHAHNLNSLSDVTSFETRISFLPKTTFNYTPGAPVSCPKPRNLTYSDVTPFAASIDWTSDATNFVVAYGEGNDPEQMPTINANTTSVALSGLTPATTYRVYVKAICSADDQSNWSTPCTFTTEIACHAPTAVTASEITSNGATINWTAGDADQHSFTLAYGTGTDPDGMTQVVVSNATYKIITDLAANTNYNVYVKASCDCGYASVWSSACSFVTPCENMSFPYSENFDSYTTGISTSSTTPSDYPNITLPDCWTFNNMASTTGSYPQVFITSSSDYTVSGNALFFKASSTTYAYAILPASDEDLSALMLDFYYRTESEDAKSPQVTVGYVSDSDDMTTFTEIATYPKITTMTAKRVYFPDGLDNGYQIAFRIGGGSYSNYFASLDNIAVSYAPSCIEPLEVSSSNVTAHSAIVNWTSNASNFIVAYGTGTNPEQMNTVNASTNSATLTNLADNTEYNAFVKTLCSATDQSEWSAVCTFTTLIACPVPTEFTVSNITATNATLTWTSDADNFVIAYGTGTDPEQMATTNANANSVILTSLTPVTTYNVYVKAICSATDESVWSNVCTFTTPEVCPAPTGLAASNVTQTGATIRWTVGAYGQDNFVVAYGTGTDPDQMSTVNPHTNTVYLNLSAGVRYNVYVKTDCGDGDQSVWVGPCTFTTPVTDVITVHDGDKHNAYVPIYGNYCDEFQKCEFVMPASELQDMQGGQINSMTFYLSEPATGTWGSASFRVFLKEVDFTSISSFQGYADATTVYQGSLSGNQPTMVVTFTTPYTYTGGNLLIGFYEETKGGFSYSTFKGENVNGACVQNYNSNLDAITAIQRNFLPKTTFSYIPPAVACPRPKSLTCSDVTAFGATIAWVADADNFVVAYGTGTDPDQMSTVEVSTNSATLTSLTPATTYNVYVKAFCSATEESTWSAKATFTTAFSIPFTEDFQTSTLPTTWTQYQGLLSTAYTGTALTAGGNWKIKTDNQGLSANHLYINVYGTTIKDWFVTPSITLSSAAQLSFDLALTAFSGNGAAQTNGSDDKFAVLVSTDNGVTWTPDNIIAMWDNAGSQRVYNNIATNGETVTLSLIAYTGQTVRIAFYVESTQNNADNNLHIDNVSVEEYPANIFSTAGNWSTSSNWSQNVLPNENAFIRIDAPCTLDVNANVEGLSISNGQSLTIANGTTLTAHLIVSDDTSKLILEDGAQLRNNTQGVFATMKKNIEGYNDNISWHLIAMPMLNSPVATAATTMPYDLFRYDEPLSYWMHQQDDNHGFEEFANGQGYLYASQNDTTLCFIGQLKPSGESVTFELSNASEILPGFNLVGNPFPCNATIDLPYWVLGDDHKTLVVGSGPIAPCAAVFVKADGAEQTVTFTKVEP